MMKVRADLALCQGYGNCVIDADDVFDVDDDGVVVVLRTQVPEEDRRRVEAAVRSCPVEALALVDDSVGAGVGSTPADDAAVR